MSVGSYMANKAEHDAYHKHLNQERLAVKNANPAKKAALRQIFIDKGYKGALLDEITTQIMNNEKRRVEVIMKEELLMLVPDKNPFPTGFATFLAFIVIGLIPLLAYVIFYF